MSNSSQSLVIWTYTRLFSWRLRSWGNGFFEVGVNDDVDATVFEINVARGEVADLDGAFAAGGQHERKVNFFLGAFGVVEKSEWLDEHSNDAAETGLYCGVLCF